MNTWKSTKRVPFFLGSLGSILCANAGGTSPVSVVMMSNVFMPPEGMTVSATKQACGDLNRTFMIDEQYDLKGSTVNRSWVTMVPQV